MVGIPNLGCAGYEGSWSGEFEFLAQPNVNGVHQGLESWFSGSLRMFVLAPLHSTVALRCSILEFVEKAPGCSGLAEQWVNIKLSVPMKFVVVV